MFSNFYDFRLIQTMLVLTAVCCWLLYPFKTLQWRANEIKILHCSTSSFSDNCFQYVFQLQIQCYWWQCGVTENICISLTEGRFPPALWKFQVNLCISFKFCSLRTLKPPSPLRKFQCHLLGEFEYFLKEYNDAITKSCIVGSIFAALQKRLGY